jgi:hypothetical protein
MGLVIGIIIALATLPVAFVALMQGSNWETGQGGNPVGGAITLGIGWCIAGAVIFTHFHPIHLSW